MGHAGVLHKFSRVAGAYPPPQDMVNGGDPLDASCATVPFAPTTCQKKKKKLHVLGMGSGRLASASHN